MLATWWVWMAAGLVLGIVEMLVPGFLFAGFAIGAVATGLLLLLGLNAAPALLFVIFAVLSLAAWLVLRRVLSLGRGQVKRIDHDIND